MKLKRLTALLLAAVVMLGLFAGCSKNGNGGNANNSSTPSLIDQSKPAENAAKYAYTASYADLTIPDEKIAALNQITNAGTALYITGSTEGDEVKVLDEDGSVAWSYYESEFALFRVDPDTGVCTRLENLQLPTIPENADGSVDCYNIVGADDGTVWMLVNVYATTFDLPEDFNPDTDSMWDYPQLSNENYAILMHVAADGTTIASIDLSDITKDETQEDSDDGYYGYNNLDSFTVDKDGNLYASDYQNVYVLNADGQLLFKLASGDYAGCSVCRLNADQIGVMWSNYSYNDTGEPNEDNGRYFIPIDLAAKDFGEKVKMPSDVWSVLPGDDAYDFYYASNGNIYGYTMQSSTKEKLVDWMACDIDSNNMNGYTLLPDGRVAAILYDWRADEAHYQLVVLTRVDASEVKQKTVLTLACMYLDYDLRSWIVEYNKNSADVRINVVDYSEYNTDSDFSAGVTKLTTEILSGNIPDLFLCDNLPIDKYAAKGVVTDLYTFMDQDSTMGRDYFMQPVLKALESDGKLYELPTTFAVQTAFVLSSIADQYDTWNVAAVQDAMKDLQDGATIFSDGWTKTDVLNNCLARDLETFVDWTTGKCEFDSEAFRQLLAFCNSFPDAVDNGNGAIAYATSSDMIVDGSWEWESDIKRVARGKQLMATMGLYGFNDYIYSAYSLNGKIAFTGYPTEDGHSGNTFNIRMPFAISSSTKNADAAWDFVRSMIQKANEDEYIYYFPMSQARFNEMKTEAMTEELLYDENGNTVDWDEDGQPDKSSKGGYEALDGSGEYIQVYALTQADVDQIEAIINATTSVYDYDQEILDIVTQEVAAYFAGDKDVTATASMIQSRVNLYVQEQR